MHIPATFIRSVAEPTYAYFSLQDVATSDSPVRQWSSLIGIITAIVGNILISIALNIQRYAHKRINREWDESKKLSAKTSPDLSKGRNYGTVEQEPTKPKRQASGNNSQSKTNSNDDSETQPLKASFQSDDTLRANDNDNNNNEEHEDDEASRKSYLKSPYWWAGIVLMAVGETGNFLAYGFAPASIVSPLGVVALVSNCLIAPLILKETFRTRDLLGVLVAIGGAVTVVLSAKQSNPKLGPNDLWATIKRWEFLLYVVLTIVTIAVLMYMSPKYGERTIFIDLGLVALFGGYTALSTKGVASLLSGSLWKAFTYPLTYFLIVVLIASALLQIRYLNQALQNFDSTQVIPVQFVLFTLSVIIGSAVLYRDFESTTATRAIKFIAGCLLTFFGVYLITGGRKKGDDHEEDEEIDKDEGIRLIDDEVEEAEEAGGRTPTKHEPKSVSRRTSQDRPVTPNNQAKSSRMGSVGSLKTPSIIATPDLDAPITPNPWASSSDHLDDPPDVQTQFKTPQPSRLSTTEPETPFFTPSSVTTETPTQMTRPSVLRLPTAPADPGTPTRSSRATRPDPPRPNLSAVVAAAQSRPGPSPHNTLSRRSARGSISRLFPGPLSTPLSSSLSAVIADSIMRGEGTLRVPLRGQRSTRNTPRAARQRTGSAQADIETGQHDSFDDRDDRSESDMITPDSFAVMSRQQTIETVPTPSIDRRQFMEGGGSSEDDAVAGSGRNDDNGPVPTNLQKGKARLRSMSEALTGLLGSKIGGIGGNASGAGGSDNDVDKNGKKRAHEGG